MHAVCFDLDGTLLHFTRSYPDVLRDTFRDVLGESRDEWLETYDQAFYRRFQSCEPRPVERGFEDAVPDADAEDLAATLMDRELEMVTPAPGIHDYLDRLQDAGAAIGVVTNGVPHWQRAKLDAYDLLDSFDTFVASYEVGAHKPDTAPFELADTRLDANYYTMIGDDDADVDGATAAGWNAIRYDCTGFTGTELPSVEHSNVD